ncbi:cache domain-containing protein [Candidatus Oscillochloris fontis]|uniref:cache domain-containing protein n=1 Tax=Candidatus Oscillochloris fontis TaxID=2496868 RepID=UPI0013755542|nr:cache domain-containing protein [Candidatus Oscillochloris fontis]
MLLVVGGAGGVIDYVSQRTVIAESEQAMQELAQTASVTIASQFVHVATFPQTLAALVETLDTSAESRLHWYNTTIPALFAAAPPEVLSLTTFFEPNFIQGRPYATVWYVRDAAGAIRRITTNMPGEPGYDPDQELYNYFEQEWYTQPIASGQLTWSEPYFDAGGAEVTMVTASVPVVYHGELAGVATADVQLATINAFIAQIRPTDDSYVMLVSHKGIFIAHPRRPDLVLTATIGDAATQMQSQDLARLGAAMVGGESGLSYLRDPFTNTDMVVAYQHIDATDWSLAVLTPKADLVQPVTQLRTTLVLIGGFALASVALLGWFGTTTVLRPIVQLVRGVERFAVDRSAISLGIRRHDEIGRLAQAFEQMAAQIAQSYSDLEHVVAARTNTLQQTLNERDAHARDLALALERVQQKEQEIQALSMPVVPILKDTLVLPVVGVLDERRAQQLSSALLDAVECQKARAVILDLTGLAMIDEAIAQQIIAVAQATRLLGAHVTLVGIRPEVAQSLVALGLSLDGIRTLANLQAAVSDVLRRG